jgi:hypothetical protein
MFNSKDNKTLGVKVDGEVTKEDLVDKEDMVDKVDKVDGEVTKEGMVVNKEGMVVNKEGMEKGTITTITSNKEVGELINKTLYFIPIFNIDRIMISMIYLSMIFQ